MTSRMSIANQVNVISAESYIEVYASSDIRLLPRSYRAIDATLARPCVGIGGKEEEITWVWVDDEWLGEDQDIRLTRGPITVKAGTSSIRVYAENHHLYEEKTVKKGSLVGRILITKIVDHESVNIVQEEGIKQQKPKEFDQLMEDLGINKIKGINGSTRRSLRKLLKRRVKAFGKQNLQYEQVKKAATNN
jgi:hypothetical protein